MNSFVEVPHHIHYVQAAFPKQHDLARSLSESTTPLDSNASPVNETSAIQSTASTDSTYKLKSYLTDNFQGDQALDRTKSAISIFPGELFGGVSNGFSLFPQLALSAIAAGSRAVQPEIADKATGVLTLNSLTGVPNQAPMVSLGANIDGVVDWSRTNAFVDVEKQVRKFGSPDAPWDGSASVDANGWPTSDFGAVFIADGVHIGGTYKLSFLGRANITPVASAATVQNQVYNPTKNITTADVVVVSTADQLMLAFSNTQGGIKRLKLIRPGYAANTQQIFTTPFLKHLQRFSVLRFMDWTHTNSNTTVNWSDSPKTTDARQTVDGKGVAWWYCIQLANQLDKDLWINIPHKATDDYVIHLARLLKNKLEPERKIYVEYSNELWNSQFPQNWETRANAVTEVKTGKKPSLVYAGETTPADWTLSWRRTAKRLKEISDDFRLVFGASAINTRVRPVLAGQVANPDVVREGLVYIKKTYGTPKKYIYAIASAPYFGVWDADSNPNLTKDQVLDALSASVDFWKNSIELKRMQAYATYYGLQHIAYEGGVDTFGSNNIAAKSAASYDPRMRGLVIRYLNNWYRNGGGLFMWFVAGATHWNSQYGTWGLTEDMTNQNTPKIQAIDTVLSSLPPSVTTGDLMPAQVDARAYVGATQPYSSPYLQFVRTGWTGDYLVRADTPGTYQLKLNLNTGVSSNKLQILVNGSAIRALDVPSRGNWSVFADTPAVPLPLNEGLNVVRLKLLSGDINIKSLKFSQ